MIDRKKKIISSITFLSMLLLAFVNYTYAFEVQTHRPINEYIAKNNFSGFSLNDYLIKQLGMPKGYDEKVVGKEVFLWISDGGENEDAGTRSLNHFLNPITNQGLGINYSALMWARLPVGAQKLENYSWNDVRDYYLKALTSADKATRENYFAMTFQGVGQVMHLVQDMSIPAHTRGDKHPTYPLIGGGDGYELWAKGTIRNAAQVKAYYAVYFSSDSTSFLLPNLFDTDQYNKGTNPAITLSYNIGLAEFTNANFFNLSKLMPYLEVQS